MQGFTMSTDTMELPLDVPVEVMEVWDRHPEIVKYPHPILREKAKPVARISADIARLIKRMKELMVAANGLGLAAPQIGVSSRILIYDLQDKHGVRVMINPTILALSGEQTEPKEGCLSIPGLQGVVKRSLELKVKYFDERNRATVRRVKALEARVIQHEIDHLDGVLVRASLLHASNDDAGCK